MLKQSESANVALTKQHKRLLKWVKKNVSSVRQELTDQQEETKDKEIVLKVEVAAKRVLAVEKLLLSLMLVMMLPASDSSSTEDVEQLS